MVKHPIQPLIFDGEGVLRFKTNAIVRHLIDQGSIGLNTLAMLPFSNEDREQFAQLIGYSLSGAADLGYFSDETYGAAKRMHEAGLTEERARISQLEDMIAEARQGIKRAASAVFRIHPDDLTT